MGLKNTLALTFTKQQLSDKIRANIRMYRENVGWSQRELARRSKTSPGWINDIETGRRSGLNIGSVVSLCRALGIHPAMLFLPAELQRYHVGALTNRQYRDRVKAKAKKEGA